MPLAVPFFVPSGQSAPGAEEDDKDGPACPAMRPDRARGRNPAGDREEARLALSVNPSNPTPKWTPENPIDSMAYYLPYGDGEVAHDDCKRTNEPSPGVPALRKGDMVEVKTEGAASIALHPALKAFDNFKQQLQRLDGSVRAEGKGRQVFVCVGSDRNVIGLTREYGNRLSAIHFVNCQ